MITIGTSTINEMLLSLGALQHPSQRHESWAEQTNAVLPQDVLDDLDFLPSRFENGILLTELAADLPLLALTILITTVSTAGFGLLMGCLSLVTVNVMFINNTVYFLLLVFSGANVPLANFPVWVQRAAHLLPLTRGIQAARQVIAGASFVEVAPLLAGEILIGMCYVATGYLLFSWFEMLAKRRGTLEAF
jgi:hypothetical protein